MKKVFQLLSGITLLVLAFAACTKVDPLPSFQNGAAPVLTASATTWAPLPADSNNLGLRFNWTNPNYSVDSASVKYVLEIDSVGRNFNKAVSRTVSGALTTSMTNRELNTILLGFGFAFNTAYDIEVRVTSSHANNNEQLRSNVLRIRVTPYKIPPRVPLPGTQRLWIVGDATTFGWNNPQNPPFPAVRELTRVDETTWAGIFQLSGSGSYLILPQLGNVWDNKLAVANNTLPSLANGGAFGVNLNDNFPGNVSGGAGWYRMVFDFQAGQFTVTRRTDPLPERLWALGDGTAGGWNNNPPTNQELTQLTNGIFQITMATQPGRFIKFVSNPGNWQPQFGGSSATGGVLGANFGSGGDPDAIPTPAVAGNYRYTLNFHTNRYTVEVQ
ncbi:MAG: hypothetical protein EAY72_01045 [Bacteroidetes bacterium]|nr:MAG: hypothetical protein EAY72_01045 [Bacteroidota bacterium]TAE69392.1 MAG: hypothetical protein EAY68_03745 [Bacteroidota bacterium]